MVTKSEVDSWTLFEEKLKSKGTDITIETVSANERSCLGQTSSGNEIFIIQNHGSYYLLGMNREEHALLDAFNQVVGGSPFCTYLDELTGFKVYEWDKEDPEGRFQELLKGGARSLKKIKEQP